MRESSVVGHGLRILLGGGIGAGKTVAGCQFAALGFAVAEADRIGHEILEPGGAAFAAVTALFPDVATGGRIDRARLAEIVFADTSRLAELEAITHPHIVRRIEEISAGSNRLVVEVPVLFDPSADWTKVYLVADSTVRRRRAVLRGGGVEDVGRRMKRQAEHTAWVAWADEIIENNGTIADLNRAVDVLVRRLESSPVR